MKLKRRPRRIKDLTTQPAQDAPAQTPAESPAPEPTLAPLEAPPFIIGRSPLGEFAKTCDTDE